MLGPDSSREDLPRPAWSFFQTESSCQCWYMKRNQCFVTKKCMVYVPLSLLKQSSRWGGHKATCCVSSEWGDGKNALPPDWTAPLAFVTCMFVCLWVDGRALKACMTHSVTELGHFSGFFLVFYTWRLQTLQVGAYVWNRNRKYSCLHVLSRTKNWYGFYTHILLPYLDSQHGSYKGVCVCVSRNVSVLS